VRHWRRQTDQIVPNYVKSPGGFVVENGRESTGDLEQPEGMNRRAGQAWPPPELVDRFIPDVDFHFRLGEDTPLPDEPDALSQARHFRDVLGLFATGVTVVTSMSEGEPVGMTCQSFSSVSLTPPLVMFCPARTSRAWPLMKRAGHFCANILSDGQQRLADAMATKGSEKFDGVSWSLSKTGAPLIDGVVGYVDCTVQAVHEAGDHYVVVGRVQDLGHGDAPTGERPLHFHRGRYTRPET
jgi:3-hydroxy-9,10-secoandrosta-1,3,5(10)-triene-9,17-dione monooxygenase reductase component